MVDTNTNMYTHLSLKDLIEARDMFHAHLINKKNVVATAVGRYLIRTRDIDANGKYRPLGGKKPARTLQNSVVLDISWPCVLVFVKDWKEPAELIATNATDFVPKAIYMPDGRVVPVCVVLAEKNSISDSGVALESLRFPTNYVGGGFPLIIPSQGIQRIASIGGIVSDGHKYYALTNKHVTGTPGQEIFTKFGSQTTRIGVSSGINLGKVPFSQLYPGWQNHNMLVNCDAGLMEIDDINQWKTDIIDLPQMGEMYDLNTLNLGLNLIAEYTKKNGKTVSLNNANVSAHGAVGGDMKGEIRALFYRYKSVGGTEYVSDFLIGGRGGSVLNVFHGDSGTMWLMEAIEKADDGTETVTYRPLAIHWGQHEILDADGKKQFTYSMATSLSNICRELEVDLVRGWNVDDDYSWAKTGHFKIAARSCDLTSDANLDKLLKANKKLIGYEDDTLIDGSKLAKAKDETFIPLADVPDLWWRYRREATEGSNHFADMDESNKKVMKGKNLLDLCLDKDNVSVDFWIQFYAEMDKVDPKTKISRTTKKEVPDPRLGALPFRVWQLYNIMVDAVANNKIDEFICAGGTLTHYVGDACQPLHVSYLHAGVPGHETDVHGDYEDTLIFRNAKDLFTKVNAKKATVKKTDLIKGGKAAAVLTIELMRKTFDTLKPMTIIKCFEKNTGRGKYEKAWKELGPATVKVIAGGCYTMAVLWQSAWKEGQEKRGKNIAASELKARSTKNLMTLYKGSTFAHSYKLTDPKFKAALK